MQIPSDIEIAQSTVMQPIAEVAAAAGIDDSCLELYGKYKAKIDQNALRMEDTGAPRGKLVLVTAINPTPTGECGNRHSTNEV